MQIYEIKFNFMNHSAKRIVQRRLYFTITFVMCIGHNIIIYHYYYIGVAVATAHLYELHIHNNIILYTSVPTVDIKRMYNFLTSLYKLHFIRISRR